MKTQEKALTVGFFLLGVGVAWYFLKNLTKPVVTMGGAGTTSNLISLDAAKAAIIESAMKKTQVSEGMVTRLEPVAIELRDAEAAAIATRELRYIDPKLAVA
jgi:hypothetical protein